MTAFLSWLSLVLTVSAGATLLRAHYLPPSAISRRRILIALNEKRFDTLLRSGIPSRHFAWEIPGSDGRSLGYSGGVNTVAAGSEENIVAIFETSCVNRLAL